METANQPASTRDRLVEAGARRFYRDGFRNVGIDAILADVGITKTAFYKHFESKDDLMIEVLDRHSAWFEDRFAAMVRQRGGGTAVGELRAVFDVVQDVIESKEFHGCIFVNAIMEFPLPHDPAHQAAVRNKRAIETLVRALAEKAGARDPAALAQELCVIIEGTYVTTQIGGSDGAIGVARRMANRIIDDALRS